MYKKNLEAVFWTYNTCLINFMLSIFSKNWPFKPAVFCIVSYILIFLDI